MNPTYLCIGGPLDGQYRSMPPDTISFRVTRPLPPGCLPHGRVSDDSVEYQLIWSGEHGRMVWWCMP